MTSADDAVLLCASRRYHLTLQHWKAFEKQDAKQINAMPNMTLQQVHDLRKAQEDLNFTKSIYLEFYQKMAKHACTTELNNLIRGDFNRVDVELHIPKLPPKNNVQEEYAPLLQLDKVTELYDAMDKSSP